MGRKYVEAVLMHVNLSSLHEYKVLMALAHHANDQTGVAFPSQNRMWRYLHVAHKANVTKALNQLEKRGLIERVGLQPGLPRNRAPMRYRLLIECNDRCFQDRNAHYPEGLDSVEYPPLFSERTPPSEVPTPAPPGVPDEAPLEGSEVPMGAPLDESEVPVGAPQDQAEVPDEAPLGVPEQAPRGGSEVPVGVAWGARGGTQIASNKTHLSSVCVSEIRQSESRTRAGSSQDDSDTTSAHTSSARSYLESPGTGKPWSSSASEAGKVQNAISRATADTWSQTFPDAVPMPDALDRRIAKQAQAHAQHTHADSAAAIQLVEAACAAVALTEEYGRARWPQERPVRQVLGTVATRTASLLMDGHDLLATRRAVSAAAADEAVNVEFFLANGAGKALQSASSPNGSRAAHGDAVGDAREALRLYEQQLNSQGGA